MCCGNSSRAPTGHPVTQAASSPSLSEAGTAPALRLGELSPTCHFHMKGSGTQGCPSCLPAGPVNGRSRLQPSVPPWPARAHAEALCAKSQQSRSAGTGAEEPGVGPGVVAMNRRDEPHAAYGTGKVRVMKTVRHTRSGRRSAENGSREGADVSMGCRRRPALPFHVDEAWSGQSVAKTLPWPG